MCKGENSISKFMHIFNYRSVISEAKIFSNNKKAGWVKYIVCRYICMCINMYNVQLCSYVCCAFFKLVCMGWQIMWEPKLFICDTSRCLYVCRLVDMYVPFAVLTIFAREKASAKSTIHLLCARIYCNPRKTTKKRKNAKCKI